jgi:hypothetical protein
MLAADRQSSPSEEKKTIIGDGAIPRKGFDLVEGKLF